ncbi:hypothetical protein ACTSKR_09830 [Chitinibacteraceae bacterium HSL-7]
MKQGDDTRAQIMAAALHTLGWFKWPQLLLAAHSAWMLTASPLFAVPLVLSLTGLYYSLRLDFDARLFALVAQSSHFDEALHGVIGGQSPQEPRTLDARWAGTRVLIRQMAVLSLLGLVSWITLHAGVAFLTV